MRGCVTPESANPRLVPDRDTGREMSSFSFWIYSVVGCADFSVGNIVDGYYPYPVISVRTKARTGL